MTIQLGVTIPPSSLSTFIPVCIAVRDHVKHLTLYQLCHQPTAQQLHSSLTSLSHTSQQSLKTPQQSSLLSTFNIILQTHV